MICWINDFERVEFNITTHCQAKCPLCPRTIELNSRKFPLSHMPLKNFKLFIQPLINSNIKTIELCGDFGDPFTHPHLELFIDYAINSGFSVEVATNGGLKGPEFFSMLGTKFKHKLRVCFSIDGISSETNSIYRIGVDFQKAFSNLTTFHKASPGNAFWYFIVFKHNIHEVHDVLKYCARVNLKVKILINKRDWHSRLDDKDQLKLLEYMKKNWPDIKVS